MFKELRARVVLPNAAFPLPPCDAGELKRRLSDEHRVVVSIIDWPAPGQEGPEGVAVCPRGVSVQGYNTREDAEALVRALENLLPVKSAV